MPVDEALRRRAHRHGRSSDAETVALADAADATLVTADRRLAAVATAPAHPA